MTTFASTAQRTINAVVVSAGLMQKTVKVRIGTQQWDNHIRKKYNRTKHLLVHDPASSVRTGDVIAIQAGWRVSRHVHHVVSSIIAPFGDPIDERPPVPSAEERTAERMKKRERKEVRRAARDVEADVEALMEAEGGKLESEGERVKKTA